MKSLFLALSLFTSLVAQAAPIQATDDPMIDVTLVEGHAKIPTAGDLTGSVVSVYAGGAYSFERYLVTVGNMAAPAEGDSVVQKTFEIGPFHEPVTQAFSRQIDKNTYSIAFYTQTSSMDDNGNVKYKKAKVLLKVRLTAEGIANEADLQIVDAK